MFCISRIVDDTLAQKFGNGRNKFYVEQRCFNPCVAGSYVCIRCTSKSTTGVLQTSRKFNHGKVNEPIPDASHIFGGKWYNEGVNKYGQPDADSIQFAFDYQKKARGGIDIPVVEQNVVIEPVHMPAPTKKKNHLPKMIDNDGTADVKQEQKQEQEQGQEQEQTAKPTKKRASKPKLILEESTEPPLNNEGKPKSKTIKIVKPRSKKTETPSPYSSIIAETPQLVHKEISLPTHIETTLEEIDTEGFDIEYVKLSTIQIGGATYLIDSTKNKLYKKIKEKGVGAYVGRWNSNTDMIVADIPDSDDERDNDE